MSSADRHELAAELDRQNRRLGSLSTINNRAAAERAGLHPTDWDCLDVLDWTGPASQTTLSTHLGLSPGAVTGVIDRLERAGCVRRDPDPDDRRRTIVTPTYGPALDHLADGFAVLASELAALTADYSDDQLRTITSYLTGLNDALQRSTEQFRSAPVATPSADSD